MVGVMGNVMTEMRSRERLELDYIRNIYLLPSINLKVHSVFQLL